MTDQQLVAQGFDLARAWRGGVGLSSYVGSSSLGLAAAEGTTRSSAVGPSAPRAPRARVAPWTMKALQTRSRRQRLADEIRTAWLATGPHWCACGCGGALRPPELLRGPKLPVFLPNHGFKGLLTREERAHLKLEQARFYRSLIRVQKTERLEAMRARMLEAR